MLLCCPSNVQPILSLGLTVANRLTQDPKVTVLVIESGQDGQGDPRLTDPGKSVYCISSISSNVFSCKLDCFPTLNSDISVINSPDFNWGLVTTNQTVGGLAQNLVVSAFFFSFLYKIFSA